MDAHLSRRDKEAIGWKPITKTLRTVAAMAMILASFALVSGWMSVAMAGGGKWAG